MPAAYAQDSWQTSPNLTLNYGLRWDRIEPWYEKYNQISTFAAGQAVGCLSGSTGGHPVSDRSGSAPHNCATRR